ncbi:MAG: CHAD domain-containing protein [Pseudomonadota bacterium]
MALAAYDLQQEATQLDWVIKVTGKMGSEVEFKLSIKPQDASLVGLHPTVVAASVNKPIAREILTIYYDTTDLRLLDAGISLRLRRVSDRWIQSVKAVATARVGLHERMEWESVVPSCHPDFTVILDPILIQLFADSKLRDSLKPIFQTKVERHEWQLNFGGGDRVELALDVGQLLVGKKHEPISEIELELKGGKKGRLFDLALELQKVIPLKLENASKAQNGYAFYRARPLSIFKPSQLKLKRSASASSAFKEIVWDCIDHLQKNQDMVLYGTDLEGLHQMRVALHRLRSAFSLFRKILGDESADVLISELRWLNEALGEARDLDVFVTQTTPTIIKQFKNHAGLLKLEQKALLAKAEAYKGLRSTLLSQRYQVFLLTLAAWLENERWCGTVDNSKEVKVFDMANAMLNKRYKQLRQRGKGVTLMHTEERHVTRISAKKLRYAAEFFATLYSSKKSTAFIRSLSQLQDCLGVLNDMTVTEKLVQKLKGTRPDRKIDEAMYIIAGWNACDVTNSLKYLEELWHVFTCKNKFWS